MPSDNNRGRWMVLSTSYARRRFCGTLRVSPERLRGAGLVADKVAGEDDGGGRGMIPMACSTSMGFNAR